MLRLTLYAIGLTAILACGSISAADIKVTRGIVKFVGPIIPGDYQRLLVAIVSETENSTSFANERHLFITSDGGDVAESLKIGRFVADTYTTVWVVDRCNSACFLILASAARRNMISEGGKLPQIGLHNIYLPSMSTEGLSGSKLAEKIRNANRSARDVLLELEVPTEIIDKMVSRTSSELYDLSPVDRINLGRYRPSINQVRSTKCQAKTEFERYMDHLLYRVPPPSEIPANRVTNLSSYEAYTTEVNDCFERIFKNDAVISIGTHMQRMADEITRRKK